MSARPGSAALGGAAAATAFELSSLDPAQPQAFYLPSTSLERLSDCFAVVRGVRLPLHSQVLSTHSAVLRDLFLAQLEGDVGAALEASPDLSAAFEGSSVEGSACFLRFLYCSRDACMASFVALTTAGHLAGVARLAHKLDAESLVQELAGFALDLASRPPADVASLQELLEAFRVADACQSSTGQSRCLNALAGVLKAMGPDWPEGQMEALAALSSHALAKLLQLSEKLKARPRSSRTTAGGFTWAIEGFSKLQGSVGIASPWVDVGGFKWRLEAFPKGYGPGKDTHLAVALRLDAARAQAAGVSAVAAQMAFSVLDQRIGDGPFADHTLGKSAKLIISKPERGYPTFMPLETLHNTDNGFLLHDRLLLRLDLWISGVERVPPQRADGGFFRLAGWWLFASWWVA